MRKFLPYIICAAFTLLTLSASASGRKDRQRDTTLYSDTYLDTVQVNRVFTLNDYMLIGFEAGSGFNRMMFNPAYMQSWRRFPEHYEVTFTRYGKMFGYMPYFGFKIGAAYSHEGYLMKRNEESGFIGSISGATEAQYDVVEALFLTHVHFDVPHFKLIADIGPYVGKRLNIERIGGNTPDLLRNEFMDWDRRLDYGFRAAAGFAIVMDPVEFHVTAKFRYGLQNLFDPDYESPYYYNYAYPRDLMITAGLHFQLSKKTGKTRSALRKEAYKAVFGEKQEL